MDIPTSPPTSLLRLLVVDDDVEFLRALRYVLKIWGYDSTFVMSGDEARELLAIASFDLVLTDINLCGMTGIDLLRYIRERDKHLPVILMTGGPELETARLAVELNAQSYLIKPFPLPQLKEIITRAVILSHSARPPSASATPISGPAVSATMPSDEADAPEPRPLAKLLPNLDDGVPGPPMGVPVKSPTAIDPDSSIAKASECLRTERFATTMTLPETLRAAAREGRLNVLVGAGPSIDAGLPNWSSLLVQLAKELGGEDRAEVCRLVEAERLLDAAQLLSEYLAPVVLHDALRGILDRATEPSPIHHAIWALEPPLVLTTNFDVLLETAYSRMYHRAPVVVLGNDRAGLGSVRTRGRICKLHGDLGSPESIVLSRKQYHDSIDRIAWSGGLWTQFAERPCLAIGYSARDPDLHLLLHWMDASLKGYAQPLYLLTSETRRSELALLRSFKGITPVVYSSQQGHQAPVLNALGNLAGEHSAAQYVGSVSASELAMLRRTRLELRTALHNMQNRFATLDLQVSNLAHKTSVETHSDVDFQPEIDGMSLQLARIRAGLDSLQRLARSSGKRSSQSAWEECRKDLLLYLEALRQQGIAIDHDILDSTEYDLPVGVELYSMLVTIIVDNAMDAVRAKDAPLIRVVASLSSQDARHSLVTTVTDNGPGVDESVNGRLFQPGCSTKGPHRGEGLFLLRVAVEEAGGVVSIDSSKGRGTVVQFVLPVLSHASAHGQIQSLRRGRIEPLAKRVRVLICDDDADFLAETVRLLESFNCEVVARNDPRTLLHGQESDIPRPDVIICDVVVGSGVSGMDVIGAIRRAYPNVPAILISGFVDQRTAHFPNARFLAKGFDIADLRALILASMSDGE